MLRKQSFFTLLIFFFLILSVQAQQDKKSIPLKEILEKISILHHVKFNYIEEELVFYRLIPPKEESVLSEKIVYIETNTRLKIKKISENYYSVYNNSKLDKPLCGFLLDNETGQPVDNAIITILKNNISVNSDEKGYFELPIVSTNPIEITHLGFEKKIVEPIEIYVADCPRIKMNPIIQSLDEVVTQRYLTSGISKKNDGSLQIKPTKFGILPGLIEPDVLQTMQQVPGINSVDETVSNINVRGGTHDQNLFLWNGIRIFQTGHFFGLISAFNPSLAQTISVTKNGSSAFYNEGVSSSVLISSHPKSIDKTNSSISTNLISAEFYSQIKASEKASFIISGRRSFTDFFNSPTYRNYRNKVFQNTVVTNLNSNQTIDFKTDEDFYFYDVTAQYLQKIGSKNQLSIDAISINNSLGLNQFTTDARRNSDLKQKNLGTTVNWTTNWNKKNSTQIQGYYSGYSLVSKNESIQTSQILNQENKVSDLGALIRNTHKISNTITFNNGYQFDQLSVTNFDEINLPFFSRKSISVLRNHALIAEGLYESENHRTFLNAGIRANYFAKFKSTLIEPRLQFSHALGKSFRVELLGEQKSQTLSQVIDLQQDFLGLEKRRWTLANNTTIPIQKSNQVSLGFSYRDKNWLITLDNFYKKIKGITTSSQGFQNQFELVRSTGDYQVIGSEILVQKNFGKFYSWLSYSYNDNKYFFNQLQPNQFINNFELRHAVSWAGIYERRSLKLALGAKWHTGKPYTTPLSPALNDEGQIEYSSPNNATLKDFLQVNFSASKNWKLDDSMVLQANVSVLNIFNTKNSINKFYRINTTNNAIESVDIYALELTPNVNLKLSF